jgi:succinate-semialdehyde dehydrogenase/glutarate-semialdehyde dehydrogenase
MALRDSRLLRQQCYLDGNWIDADNGAVEAINNPAIGRKLGTVPTLGTVETRRAIAAAEKAFPGWRALTAKQRSAILRRWFELCVANQEDLATIMTLEQGKPLAESRGEIAYGSAFIEWFAEEGRRVYGDVTPAKHGTGVSWC